MRRRGWGAHVKPSTATTGSRMMSMVKYLHKRRVKWPMTGEQQAAGGAAEGTGVSLISHVIGHSVLLRHRLVKRGYSDGSNATCNRTCGRRVRGSIETACGRCSSPIVN